MFRFSLFGITITVEPWFWVTMAFLGGALRINSTDGLLQVVLFVLAGFISILVHEMGHALMIRKYQLPTQIVLTTFGGYATHPSGVLSRKQSFLVTAAGPGIQIILGLLVLAFVLNFRMPSPHFSHFAWTLCGISLFWAILNCLPIFPLDGGQMLAAILGPRRAKAVHTTGVVCAGILGVLAFANSQVFIAVFMGFFAYQNYQMLQQAR